MEENNNKGGSKNKELKYALCYVPFFFIGLYFIEKKKTEEFNKHIKYAAFIFIAYLILQVALGALFGSFIFLLYVGLSGFLGWKAYNGENVDLSVIDDLEKKIKEKK